jgi:RHS repeat-associated protein
MAAATLPPTAPSYPYGSSRSSTGVSDTDRLFTGQHLDGGSGLYYYNARSYDTELGRFISPDPLVIGAHYAYAANNPLRYVDPSGYCTTNTSDGSGGFLADDTGEHFNCTADQLADLGWDTRVWWLQSLAQEAQVGSDFNNFEGLLTGVNVFALDGWVSYADAVGLWQIQNGYRMSRGKDAVESVTEGAKQWNTYFSAKRVESYQDDTQAFWVRAEQTSIDFAIAHTYRVKGEPS